MSNKNIVRSIYFMLAIHFHYMRCQYLTNVVPNGDHGVPIYPPTPRTIQEEHRFIRNED